MPRVPEVETRQERISFVPSTSASDTLSVANSFATAFGRAAVYGIREKQKFEEDRAKQRSREEQDAAFAGFSTDVADLAFEVGRGDDIQSITQNFDDGLAEITKRVLDGVQDETARENLVALTTRLGTAHRISVMGDQFEREQAYGLMTMDQNLEKLATDFARAPNSVVANEIVDRTTDFIDSSELLLAEQKGPLKDKVLSNFDKRRVSMLIELSDAADSDSESITHLETALTLLNDPEELSNLNSAERTSLRGVVEAQRDASFSKLHLGEMRSLRQDIEKATTNNDFDDAERRTDQLLDMNIISEEKAISFDLARFARMERLRSSDNGAAIVDSKIRLGIPIDPKDRDQVDAYYEEIFIPGIEGDDEDEQYKAVVDLVGDIDVLPRKVESALRAAASNGSDQKIAEAAQLFRDLRNASPQAVARIEDPTSIFYENIVESMDLNVPQAEAIKTSRERGKLNPSIIRERKEVYNEEQRNGSDKEWLYDNIGELEIKKPFFQFDVGADDVPAGLVGMYKSEVERLYILDDDIEKARTRAFERIKQVWGTTAVGGEPKIVWLPPELIYPHFRGDSNAVEKDVIGDLRQGNFTQIDGITDSELADRIHLIPDDQSGREFDPERGVATPGYLVYIETDEGDPVPLHGDDGIIARYSPNFPSSLDSSESFGTSSYLRQNRLPSVGSQVAEVAAAVAKSAIGPVIPKVLSDLKNAGERFPDALSKSIKTLKNSGDTRGSKRLAAALSKLNPVNSDEIRDFFEGIPDPGPEVRPTVRRTR